MAEVDVKWGLKMDKIAYAAAAAIGLIVLIVPVALTGQVRDTALFAELDSFRKKAGEFRDEIAGVEIKAKPLAEVLSRQWDAGAASTLDPRWVTERSPVVIRTTPTAPVSHPEHKAGQLQELSCQRDLEKKEPFILVKGAMSQENAFVVIQKVDLLRKENDGDYAPVKQFSAKGDFEYADHDVTPGSKYGYKFVTHADRDPTAPASVKALPDDQKKVESNELVSVEPVPYDYSLTVSSVEPIKDANDVPRFLGKFSYWDYKEGKVVEHGGGQLSSFTEKDKVGEGKRFEIFRVDDVSRLVIVKDLWRTARADNRETFTQKEARTARPVACWKAPVTLEPPPSAAPAEGEEGAEAAPEDAEEKPAAPKKVAPPKKETTPKKGTTSKEKESTSKPKTSGKRFK